MSADPWDQFPVATELPSGEDPWAKFPLANESTPAPTPAAPTALAPTPEPSFGPIDATRRALFGNNAAEADAGQYKTGVLSSAYETLTNAGENKAGFATAAKRLPGNTWRGIKAGAKSFVQSGIEYLNETQAEIDKQNAARATDPNYNPLAAVFKKSAADDAKALLEDADVARERAKSAALKAWQARSAEERAMPADAGTIEKAIQSGFQSALPTIAAMAVAGPVGGVALMGAQTAATRRSELKDKGVDEGRANTSAALLGTLESLSEYLPGVTALKRIPGFWKHIAEFFASEIPGENATTIAGLLDDYSLGLRDG